MNTYLFFRNCLTNLIKQIIIDNGIKDVEIYTDGRKLLTILGFYRPTKNWDLLVIRKRQLLAAIELKSQVGPSFGNNFNNRVEEALGNATDLNTAFREGAFGESSKPFLGYFFVLEECSKSMMPVRITSPHFPTFPEFDDTSYAMRYEILCRKLVQEQLYDAAALILTSKESENSGKCRPLSDLTSAKRFVINLAGRMSSFALD
ncbi:Type II restriction enzyme PaeR7I [hydrothermal vent metagenome]|uniref:Type II restriction enzyme PaeR7I n=1 Tax=hydrothermal vent metagenome TaxID=652676 RepID=A0A3B0VVR4_9ZZZZ